MFAVFVFYICAMPENIASINSLLQAYFDKVLVVTVPRFKERQEKVKQRLAGIQFEFFYGADKQELDAGKISALYHFDKKKTLAPGYYFKPMNEGEIACALSHRMVYQAMIENNWEKVLILEDDVVPDWEKLERLDAVLDELPGDWELFYLGYLKNEQVTAAAKRKNAWYRFMAIMGLSKMPLPMIRRMLPMDFSPHLRRAGFHDCTHAYAVSISAAKKLLAAQTPVGYRADNLLTALTLKEELSSYVSKNYLFNQEVFTDQTDQSMIRAKWANQ